MGQFFTDFTDGVVGQPPPNWTARAGVADGQFRQWMDNSEIYRGANYLPADKEPI